MISKVICNARICLASLMSNLSVVYNIHCICVFSFSISVMSYLYFCSISNLICDASTCPDSDRYRDMTGISGWMDNNSSRTPDDWHHLFSFPFSDKLVIMYLSIYEFCICVFVYLCMLFCVIPCLDKWTAQQ